MDPWLRMITAVSALAGAVVVAIVALWRRHRRRRDRLYAELASARGDIVREHPVNISRPGTASQVAARFQEMRLVTVPEFLTSNDLVRLCQEARLILPRAERSFIPTHKKGGTVAYETLHRFAPGCAAFYHSPEVMEFVSQVTGVRVLPTPDQDQSSLSLLCYTEAGDHIQWHYDHNFYRGRHFTVLLSLINRGPDGGLSQCQFQELRAGGEVVNHETAPNTLVVFEGARIRHRATPLGSGDERLMLSMTYSADPRISRFREFIRRIKDTAFYGLRALWD